LWAKTRFATPPGVSDVEMQRRWLVIAAALVTVSIVGGLLVAGLERLQRWVERKRDPWRRLD